MIETKTFELLDRMTFVPVIAVRIAPLEWNSIADVYLARRAGYADAMILLTSLYGDDKAQYDPYSWQGRTYGAAHLYIAEHWFELESGSVIDIEFILGETTKSKLSEREETP